MAAEERQRFDTAQSMFTPSEAKVYRKLENVLISAHGFDFPSGQSEINTDNFVLLKKVIKVIALFPGSTIEISGHTDSTGSAELNLKLSQQRAANVAKFLNEVGGISNVRLSWEGFGKERPVASNETAEGRASNRRVEILIVNQ
jgi:outer membrane protein OmpA-like peptidoglycan-associated protein